MCLSLVGRVCAVDGDQADVDVDGRHRPVSVALQTLEGTAVREGDWVLVHTGFAVAVLEPAEAAEILAARDEYAEAEGNP